MYINYRKCYKYKKKLIFFVFFKTIYSVGYYEKNKNNQKINQNKQAKMTVFNIYIFIINLVLLIYIFLILNYL